MDDQIRTANSDHSSTNPPSRHSVALRPWVVVIVVVLLAAAGLAAWMLLRGSSQVSIAGRPVPAPDGTPVPQPGGAASNGTAPPGEIVITLSTEKFENAQIKTEVVTAQTGMAAPGAVEVRTTGTVQSNAYKEVPVFPVAGGIVRQVNVELGNRVARGQTLATIFSTELADAQSNYLKMAAEVEEHHQHHHRTTALVEIGAASREELEQATSMNKTAEAGLASARERLVLLGMTEKQIEALGNTQRISKPLLAVESPTSGTLIARAVNTGEVVMQTKEMFRIADLSTVWVIGQLYDRDFQAVHLGTAAVVTTAAYPGRSFKAAVSYIDPRVDPQTRTAQVRIELANPGEMLRLGMFVDVNFGGAPQTAASGQAVAVVPVSAVQNIGGRQIVFVATDRPAAFAQREVSVGQEMNGMVPVYNGVSAGERVVTDGSFLLRAESLKMNPSQPMSHAPESAAPSGSVAPSVSERAQQEGGVQVATVVVAENGFRPETINLKRGTPARVTFIREVEATCATAVAIPEFNIKRDLPFKEPVTVEFTPAKKGVYSFSCGMGMLNGKIVVQ
ncbi:MAG TPA: efflux RND transporter periplasmic adaptor subunit [Blastocatellia bacterium]|nr:efflux RND transporter periplasmic adaptor subunit [Blastocatellia bacterium]